MMDTQPVQPSFHLQVGVISRTGHAHSQNQDSYRIDPARGLFLIADGIGGQRAGEVASRIAVEVMYQVLTSTAAEHLQTVLGNALLAAHHAIRQAADENEAYRGMGTTALIGWIRIPALVLWTAHIGNSRAYLWREGLLQQLTDDHTLLNELRKANRLPDNPRDWPTPNILSQALGTRQPVLAPGFGEWTLATGDRLMFCTDGLSDILPAQDINSILSSANDPQLTCEQLAHAAQKRDASDDLTVVVVEVRSKASLPIAIQTVQMMEVER